MITKALGESALLGHANVSLRLLTSHVEGGRLDKLRALVACLRSILRCRQDLDVVHLQMAAGASVERKLVILLAAKILRIPAVVQLHGADAQEDFEGGQWYHRWAFQSVGALATEIMVLGQPTQKWLSGLGWANVSVVPNFVSIPEDVAELPASPSFLFVGRVSQRKGIWDLLDAVQTAGLPKGTRLVVAGDGEVEQLRHRIAVNPPPIRVDVLGWTPHSDLAALFGEAWAVVLPSYNEGLPMALLEGMAAGRAVIATPVGAVPDLVRHGKNGLLTRPGDPESLGACLRRLASDRELSRALGAQGRRDVTFRYSEQVVVAQLADQYWAACQARQRPR